MPRTIALVTAIIVLLTALAVIMEAVLPGQLINTEYSVQRSVHFSEAGDARVDLYVQYSGFGREERISWIRQKGTELIRYETGVLKKTRIIDAYPDSVIVKHGSTFMPRGEGDGTIVFSIEERVDTLRVRVRQSPRNFVLAEI